MSKMMSELNQLNEARKKQGNIIVEDQEARNDEAPIVKESKGIIIMCILLVVVIGISAFSMSVSLKTYSQLESSIENTKKVHLTLQRQTGDVMALKELVTSNSKEELTRITQINDQIKDLKLVIKKRDQEMVDIKADNIAIQTSLKIAVDKLNVADNLILSKFALLKEKVNEALKYNSTYLNTY